MFSRNLLALTISTILLGGCSSGGSDSSDSSDSSSSSSSSGSTSSDSSAQVVGLSTPEQVDVVGASDDSTSSQMRANIFAAMAARAFNDAGTDYTTDKQHTHVWHPALQPVEMVNSILCFIDQLQADEMMGQGAYAALVDDSQCESGDSAGSSASGNQSSGADKAPEFIETVAQASRASNDDPMVVNIWIPEMEMGPDGETAMIKAKVVVNESPSNSKPFGDFNMSFGFFPEGASESAGGGELATTENSDNKFGFTLYQSSTHDFEGMSVSMSERASVLTDEGQKNGVAVTQNSLTLPEGIQLPPEMMEEMNGKAYALSYNDLNVKVKSASDFDSLDANSDEEACLSRTNFREAVWRYNLYDAQSGERVDLNSGFPFRYATDSNNPAQYDGFGYVGYWGLWTESPSGLENGQTIVRETFGPDSASGAQEYTVTTIPGRMIKHTVEKLALTELEGIEFNYWDEQLSQGQDQWVVAYLSGDNASNGDGFYKTGSLSYGQFGPSTTDITPEKITLQNEHDALHMWSEQLGGGVMWKNGDDEITFFSEEYVDGDETGTGELFVSGNTVTFYCYSDCPIGTLSEESLSSFDGPFDNPLHDSNGNPDSVTPIQYTFSLTGDNQLTLVRVSNSEPVKMADAISRDGLQSTFHSWGVRSGNLVTSQLDDPFDVYNPDEVTTFYVWETGLDEWNQMSIVKQNGNVVAFDKPIQFRYTHTTGKDRSTDTNVASRFNNQTFMLEYGGQGNLWGIPHKAVGATSDTVNENEEHVRYYPAFNIADGVSMGPTGSEYVVKAIDIEQKMALDENGCQNLMFDGLVEPPSALSASYDINIGDMPEVDSSPAVVGGVVQVSSGS